MSDDDLQKHMIEDDDLPEPGPTYADMLHKDKYNVVRHCLYIEGAGWVWQQVE